MFVGHELWDQRNNALDIFGSSLGQVSLFHRCEFVQRDLQCLAVRWNWLAAVLIGFHHNMPAYITGTKLDVVFASKACWRMDWCSQCDFYWFLLISIIRDVHHLRWRSATWLQKPPQLDVKTWTTWLAMASKKEVLNPNLQSLRHFSPWNSADSTIGDRCA